MAIFSLFRKPASGGAVRLTPEKYLRRRDADAVVLDVRTAAEYAQGHLETARNLDVTAPDFHAAADRLDADKTYYLYCRSGNRSEQAARLLGAMGFEAYNIGGLEELSRAGASTAP